MTFRTAAFLCSGALFLSLSGCRPSTSIDGGPIEPEADSGRNPMPLDRCSGGCANNQKCDAATRTCVDGCDGTCTNAQLCVKNAAGAFECTNNGLRCGGVACAPGEDRCISGQCACSKAKAGAPDSCSPQGQFCDGASCRDPARFQQCRLTAAPCPTGFVCKPVFGEDQAICTKECTSNNVCDLGELCSDVGCLPSGLFSGQFCAVAVDRVDDAGVRVTDGGVDVRAVTVGSKCAQRDGTGAVTQGPPTGTCRFSFFAFYEQGTFPFDYCAPGGGVAENGACKVGDTSRTGVANQCAAGLECIDSRGNGVDGLCLRTCNAQPQKPGFEPLPGCGTDEACVNVYRYLDPDNNSTLGACMKTCNVFDASQVCLPYGTNPSSCVPTGPTAGAFVSASGSGLCIPQQATVGQPNGACAEPDAFKGASCGSAQLCTAIDDDDAPTCIGVCDLDCTLATPPSRCATEANARCTGGKACTFGTNGSSVGFCL